MRKLYLILVMILAFNSTYSQSWMDLGLKGSWGLNWLMNKNIMDDQEFNHRFTSGYNFGGKIGWNFNDFHEVTVDVLFGTFRQKFSFNVQDTVTKSSPLYDKSLQFSTTDILLMYRNNKDGRYLEIGPQYSIVSRASGTNSYDENADGDIKENLVPNYFSMVFGFGSYFLGTENFGVTFGARFAYTFSDLISEKGKVNHYPANEPYDSYAETHPFTAMLVMESNLDFAYMAKAKCKNKRKLILF